ncbi:MAG TPA: RIO1 family regulatory kinase/ATPase [Polyangiaceae bacterium]|nr:RIO1 family regulatory kinase/ATPase [Polyangiaceae bacterium]
MRDTDELDARVERLRQRHAARKKNQAAPVAPVASFEASESLLERFAAAVPVTKAERAWIREHLGPLHERQLIGDVLQRIKAGKEATVYACSAGAGAPAGIVAAKLYRAQSLRGERNVAQYQQGRGVLDAEGRVLGSRAWRLQKAIAQKSRVGRRAAQSSWLMHELGVLSALSACGGDVPRPIEHNAFALLMEFIGDGAEPAPTLSQVALTRNEAKALLERLIFNLELLLGLGWVHGDLSAHNLLYQPGRLVLIDFPQVVAARDNSNARSFLERDVERIAGYFARAGVPMDAHRLSSQLWSKHVATEVAP